MLTLIIIDHNTDFAFWMFFSSTEPPTVSYKLCWGQDIYIWVVPTWSAHKRYDELIFLYCGLSFIAATSSIKSPLFASFLTSLDFSTRVVWLAPLSIEKEKRLIEVTEHKLSQWTQPFLSRHASLFLKGSVHPVHAKARGWHCHNPLPLSFYWKD